MKTLIAGLFVLAAVNAQAGIIAQYSISDYTGGKHGLWTNGTYGSDKFFSIDGLFTVRENKKGKLVGDFDATAVSQGGKVANIDLTFKKFRESTSGGLGYKKEGGRAFNPADNLPGVLAAPGNGDIDFFKKVLGTITIDGDVYDIEQCCGYGFQFGDGANAKNKVDFGGSAWLWANGYKHWDLNVNFTPVSEPSVVGLLALGLAGLVISRRRLK